MVADLECRVFDYGGRLDGIIEIRDKILRENHAIALGNWWVSEDPWRGLDIRTGWIFCYNPFKKRPGGDGWEDWEIQDPTLASTSDQ